MPERRRALLFNPGFEAGMVNPNAGSYSPTNMRLTRLDGEQNLTKFSATLPPCLLAKLAGVDTFSDAAIAAADDKKYGPLSLSPPIPSGPERRMTS